MIKAEVVAHSLSPQGDEVISILCTFPRIILAEVNTHRMLSKNTSSSRAIPFLKMVEVVITNPFIPMAWQKDHKGMQGTKYLSKTDNHSLVEFISILEKTLNTCTDEKDKVKIKKKLDEKIELIHNVLQPYVYEKKTLDEWWLFARDKCVEAATMLYVLDVTKQLCNRLLEPFMWTTMLMTGSREGWDNFFRLRCPSYDLPILALAAKDGSAFCSKKGAIGMFPEVSSFTEMDWLMCNKGQAEIHIMNLAEKIWDATAGSVPIQLKAGEWHIAFNDKIDEGYDYPMQGGEWNYHLFTNAERVKTSTAMGARTSYTVVGDEKEIDVEKMIGLHDNLVSQDPPHSSPLEHCQRAMTDDEYYQFIKGEAKPLRLGTSEEVYGGSHDEEAYGWCYNAKGFIPYRYMIDNGWSESRIFATLKN